MSPNERAARLSKDYTFVSSNTTSAWLNVAVQDMRRARACLTAGKTPSRSTLGLCDFGTETLAGQPLPTLSPEALVRAYWQANRRLIVLGLDGTLIQQEKVLDHLKLFHDFIGRSLAPPPAALHCLQALASDPANSVHVISGRGARDLEACLGSVRGLGLAAELGFCVLRPHGDVWTKRELTPTQERWKDAARPIFERCARSASPARRLAWEWGVGDRPLLNSVSPAANDISVPGICLPPIPNPILRVCARRFPPALPDVPSPGSCCAQTGSTCSGRNLRRAGATTMPTRIMAASRCGTRTHSSICAANVPSMPELSHSNPEARESAVL